MTAVAVLRLAERGALRLDDPARKWLPADITQGLGGLDGITIRHLLNMTSGMPDYLDDSYIAAATADPVTNQIARRALTYAYGYAAAFAPGRGFDYSNTNYVLAGLILEAASRESYAKVMAREVLRPAGMSGAFVFGSRALPAEFPQGHEGRTHVRDYYQHQGFGDGGVIASASDLAAFYRALFIDGTLLSDASLAQLLRDSLGEGYGLGIDLDGGIYGHAGGDLGFSSDVRFDQRTGAIAIVLAAQSDADTDWTWNMIEDR